MKLSSEKFAPNIWNSITKPKYLFRLRGGSEIGGSPSSQIPPRSSVRQHSGLFTQYKLGVRYDLHYDPLQMYILHGDALLRRLVSVGQALAVGHQVSPQSPHCTVG